MLPELPDVCANLVATYITLTWRVNTASEQSIARLAREKRIGRPHVNEQLTQECRKKASGVACETRVNTCYQENVF